MTVGWEAKVQSIRDEDDMSASLKEEKAEEEDRGMTWRVCRDGGEDRDIQLSRIG